MEIKNNSILLDLTEDDFGVLDLYLEEEEQERASAEQRSRTTENRERPTNRD